MFNDNESRYIYLRTNENKKTSHDGCICAGYIRTDNDIKMAFSFCQPLDLTVPKTDRTGDHFSRKEAHKILAERLAADPIITHLQDKDGKSDYRVEFDHGNAVDLAKHTLLKWATNNEEIHVGVKIPGWAKRWINKQHFTAVTRGEK